ncbi:MAG: hypothetical protein RRB22_07545, partial [Gammaproteobacteria bacterium]|nr:hypothetical protein [Gammaproteobacteria bacterium]
STAWTPVNPLVDHAQVLGTCASCHDGVIAIGKSGSHINTSDICEACHNSTAWVPVFIVDHNQVNGTCASAGCHSLPGGH